MRIPRNLYDTLKALERNDGYTKDIAMQALDAAYSALLISRHPQELPNQYRFIITKRGLAGLEDRPLEDNPPTQ